MKRHPSLQPLSRDHHHALVHCREVRWAREGARGRGTAAAHRGFVAAWTGEITDHFDAEERWILPRLTEDEAARLRADHARLRELARILEAAEPGGDPEALHEAAERLEAHVRWEERALYPALEERLAEDELAEIGAAFAAMEARRVR